MLRLLLPTVFSLICLSCSKHEETMQILPSSIEITGPKEIILSKAAIRTFEFKVSPAGATFNYQTGTAGCQIALETQEDDGLDINHAQTYYRLTKIEPIDQSSGTYRATVRDMNVNDRYNDMATLRIRLSDGSMIRSEAFRIRFSGSSIHSIAFLKKHNENAIYEDIPLSTGTKEINITSPLITSPMLALSFETNAYEVLVNGVRQVSGETINDFSSPVTYQVRSEDGQSKEFTIRVTHSGLPVLFIDTPSGKEIPSKYENWLPGASIRLYDTDWTLDHSGTTEIRGRGNSTWSYPKKPYALKLPEKAEILGMPKHKRWVLLANWMDRTLLRNRIAFAVSMKTGLAWTPHGEYVELVLNGKHVGNYYLCEHIKIDKNRVNIDELEDTDTDSGYMMELDTYYDEVNKFRSAYYNLPYMFKDPDEVNSEQFAFVQNYVKEMEYALRDNTKFAAREYTKYLDVDSFIDWWLIYEITGNEEPKHPKSSYMHKNTGGKFFMGPVWDFDWGTFMPHKKFVVLNRQDGMKPIYYDRLFQDPEFKKRVKERWNLLKGGFGEIPAFIESEGARIKNSELMNHTMWQIDPSYTGGYINGDELMSFDDAVSRMKKAYEDKMNWMDSQINNW